MNDKRAKRKLSAILSADVKGYSRFMGDNELATIETLKNYRELISKLIEQYGGVLLILLGTIYWQSLIVLWMLLNVR